MCGNSKKPWYIRPKLKQSEAAKLRAQLESRGKPVVTKWEDRLATILKRARISYQRQVKVQAYSVDFLIPPNTILEVTGSVHKTRRIRDLTRIQRLESWGYRVIIVPNHMLLADDANEAVLYKIRESG
jgi:very-short-patch-repair endonuclease